MSVLIVIAIALLVLGWLAYDAGRTAADPVPAPVSIWDQGTPRTAASVGYGAAWTA